MKTLEELKRPAAMDDTIFLRLDAKFALGADDLQWILYRARHKDIPLGAPLRQRDWDPVSFISSNKDILARCMREKGCFPAGQGAEWMASLTFSFKQWKAAQPGCKGRVAAAEHAPRSVDVVPA
jgi:hypothetical protein